MSEKIGKLLFQLLLAIGVAVLFFSAGRASVPIEQVVSEIGGDDEEQEESSTIIIHTTTSSVSTSTSGGLENTTVTTVSADSSESFPVHLNTATAEELMQISGIGEAYARRIIEYRDLHGGFSNLEELMNISGIGEKRFQQWSPYMTVE